MNLPPLSVLQARSTYFIGATVALLIGSGIVPVSEADQLSQTITSVTDSTLSTAMQVSAAVTGALAWWERRNPSRRLTLPGSAR